MEEEYCQTTGRKVRIICKKSKSRAIEGNLKASGEGEEGHDQSKLLSIEEEEEIEKFRSCKVTAEDDEIRVIMFQICMGLVGGIAFWQVQSRKKITMTQYDQRKQRFT
eukprot:gene13181-17660_t